jgi:exo-1,4-beta-D-glucosaminidase
MATMSVAIMCSVAATAVPMNLDSAWRLQSSADDHSSGQHISTPGYDATSWLPIQKFPATVLAALEQNGQYPDLFFDQNLEAVDATRFDVPWWYRTEMAVGAAAAGARSLLTFHGVNYRANVFVNGKQVAGNDTVVGSFGYFDLDVTDALGDATTLALAVEVSRPYDWGLDKNTSCRSRSEKQCTDLAISWVDWAPTPHDANMGLWREVVLTRSGGVTVRYPQVVTRRGRSSRSSSS